MSSKKLSQMRSYPSGHQVYSLMKYAMEQWPRSMAELYEVYEKDEGILIGWCTGFSYAMALVEDNGAPSDLDEVLHAWVENGGVYYIAEKCQEWLRANGR